MPQNTSYKATLDISDIQRQAARLRNIFAQQTKTVTIIDPKTGNAVAQQVERITFEMKELEASTERVNKQALTLNSTLGKTRPGTGLQGILGPAVAGYLSVQGARQIAQQAAELSDLAAEARRANIAFRELSGGATLARDNLSAIKSAGAGTISTLQAQKIGTQALSLGLAKTTDEFENLVRAGRAVTIVSPVIDDLGSALTEIGLSAANQSFRRLDQLGLGVTEVKERIRELKQEQRDLSDEQAFAAAVVQKLNEKYGDIIDSAEAQATGIEKARVAWEDYRAAIAQDIDSLPNQIGETMSEALRREAGFGNTQDLFGLEEQINSILDNKGLRDFATGIFKGEGRVGEEERQQLEKVLETLERFKEFDASGIQIAETLRAEFFEIGDSANRQSALTEEQEAQLDRLNQTLDVYAAGGVVAAQSANELADAQNTLGGATLASDEAVEEFVGSIEDAIASFGPLSGQVRAGLIEITNLGAASEVTASQLDQASVAAENFLASLSAAQRAGAGLERQLASQFGEYAELVGEDAAQGILEGATTAVQEQVDAFVATAAQEGRTLTAVDIARFENTLSNEFVAPIEDQIQANKDYIAEQERLQKQAAREAESAAKKAQRDAERAAEKAAREMEQAMLRAAAEMESALRSVAGLFDVSQVTQGQLDSADLGLYSDAADEFLRRLRSAAEGEDLFPDLTIDEAFDKAREALARINADVGDGTPQAIVAALDAAWEDSRLFADTQNLELINADAVRAQLDRAAQGSAGEQNILEFFGIDTETGFLAEDVGVGTALRADIESGDVSAAMASQLQAGVATADVGTAISQSFSGGAAGNALAQGFGEGLDLATPFLREMRKSFENDTIINGFLAIGRNVAGYIADGFGAGVSDENWAATVLDGIAEDIGETFESSVAEATGGAQ